MIRRTTIRETYVSRLYGDQSKVPLKPNVYHSTIVLRGLTGAVNWSPIMPRDASLSDSQFESFWSGTWKLLAEVQLKLMVKYHRRWILLIISAKIFYSWMCIILPDTSLTHWGKNTFRRTSEHNHKCIYLNFSSLHQKKICFLVTSNFLLNKNWL